MREERRDRRRELEKRNSNMKNILYITGTIIALGVIAFLITVMIYNNSLEKMYADLETEELGRVPTNNQNTTNETEETNAGLGKTVEEAKNELNENLIQDEVNQTSVENEEDVSTNGVVLDGDKENFSVPDDKIENNVAGDTNEQDNANVETPSEENSNQETKEPSFSYPVEGEIVKEYAKDNLVYSETLKEWVTHMGVDIQAEKTTVVKSAEDGKVIAIKNDPRYGTTVIVEHANGYETRYANLLTAEFVTVGEEINKGQTIGTVGDTGAFEILDTPHLHFELLKDEEYQDPMLYLK